jgi:iron(III) transport system permease protein
MLTIGFIRIWNRPWPILDQVYPSIAMVVLVYAARFLPLAVLSLSASLEKISPALEESAWTSGRSWGAGFLRVIVPLSARAIWTAWLLGFVFTMKDLDIAAVLPAANASLSVRLNNMVHFGHDERAAALCVLMVAAIGLPLILTSLVAPRWARGTGSEQAS